MPPFSPKFVVVAHPHLLLVQGVQVYNVHHFDDCHQADGHRGHVHTAPTKTLQVKTLFDCQKAVTVFVSILPPNGKFTCTLTLGDE